MDEPLAVSIAQGQLQIIFKSDLYTFTGNYSLVDDDTYMLSTTRLQFDYLVSIDGHNLAIHTADLKKLETLLEPVSIQRYAKFQLRLITPQGHIKILSAEGKVFDIYKGTAADWKKSEQNLRHAHDLLQTVFDASPHSISVYRILHNRKGEPEDFEILSLNAPTVLTIGMRADEVVGKRFGRLFPYLRQLGVFDRYVAVASTGIREDFEISADDHGVLHQYRFIVVRTGNLLVATIENVTASRQDADKLKRTELELISVKEQLAAEDKYHALFNSIDQGFCIVEIIFDDRQQAVDYRFLETNPTFEKLTDLQEVIGKSVRSLCPDHEDAWFDIYGKVATGGHPTRFIQSPRSLPGRWYEVSAFPLGDGHHNKVAILFSDITERRAAEIQLKDLNKRLRDLDKAKTKFFSNVSHELRTPLTLLLAPLDELLAEERRWPDKDLQKLQLIRRNTIRLQKLVNTLLDFSRVESQRMEAIFQPTNLAKYTAALAANFRPAVESAGLRLIVKTPELPEPIYINHDMWEKIVLNLISNALKFTHHGKIEVIIRHKKKSVELRVRDTGIGIAAENFGRIFERFARVEGVHARAYEGTGIGLALVKEFVLLHNGTIKVNSTEGRGSEFIVTLRRGKSHLPQRQVFESPTPIGRSATAEAFLEESRNWRTPPPQPIASGGVRDIVLIADDNADMREYLTSVLSEHYHIIAVENGRKALDYITGGLRPALVLTDVMMPEIDGRHLVQALRRNEATASTPVILLSARADENERIEGLTTGADDYLTKPFSARELVTLVWARIQVAKNRQETAFTLSRRNDELEHMVQERTADLVRSRRNLVLLNEALNKKNHELRTMNEELTNFTFIASHDLREPLRKIRFFCSQLAQPEKEHVSPKGRELIDRIQNSTQRLNDLIDNILTFSQTASAPRVTRTRTNLNDLVRQVIHELSAPITDTRTRIDVDPLIELWGNPVQLSQLLHNLISNAIKFQPKDRTPVISISGVSMPGKQIQSDLAHPNTRYYRLEIMDNGIGFEPQYTDRIFRMFQRLHPKEAYPGTGMGLAICKKIMENHNGFILANGTPGVGSVFYCYFPV